MVFAPAAAHKKENPEAGVIIFSKKNGSAHVL